MLVIIIFNRLYLCSHRVGAEISDGVCYQRVTNVLSTCYHNVINVLS